MSILWRKVVGDARQNGAQVALVAGVLALGTAGVVAALDARMVLGREIAASYALARSPDVALWFDKVAPEAMAIVAGHEGVAGVDARRIASARIAARDGSWLPVRLAIVGDIDAQEVAKIHRHDEGKAAGLWIEQSGRELLAGLPGSALSVRTPTGAVASVPLAGYVHDTAVAPSIQDRVIYGYATSETAVRLGQTPDPDLLLARMSARGDMANAALLADELRDALKAKGLPALRAEALPNAHPHAPLMNAMLRVLGVLAAIAAACGAALAAYLVSAWMRREVRLVGIMKAMGARWHQVALQYLLLVGPIVLAAAAVAVPLGAALGRAMVRHYAQSLNIDIADWSVPSGLLVAEVAATLGIALAAMAGPIVRASRMSVREAIHDAGIASPLTAGSRLARAIRVPGGVGATFALRNTLRRPYRLALILLALSAGGSLLLTTHSNYESLMGVIDRMLAVQGHDIEASFARAVPATQLEAAARKAEGIGIAEAWRRATVSLAPTPPDSTASRRVALLGIPPGSRLFKLPVTAGRAPAPGAVDEVLVTRSIVESHPRLRPGDEVTLQFRDRSASVRVVGFVEEIGSPSFYAGLPAFDAVTGLGDASNLLRASVTGEHAPGAALSLDQALLDAHLPPTQLITRAMVRDALDEHFKVVGDVIRMVALAAALVGAIVLAAGTSFNVLERAREIGVLRALGATRHRIATMLLAESAAIVAAGALLAIAISIALTLALNGAAERHLLHVAVPLRFSFEGLAILSAGAFVVVAAVWLALRHFLRRSVRGTLSYEG